MAKKSNPYFDDFMVMAGISCSAAEHLHKSFMNFKPADLPEMRKTMHQMENEADKVKHDMMSRLTKEFVPPIDREDIMELANELDTVTDKIEDVLIRVYMYNVLEIRPEAQQYAKIILKCCKKLEEAIAEFPRFKKSSTLMDTIIEVNTIEEEGDKCYIDAVRRLYVRETHKVELAVWTKLYDLLEECCDACEHVANVMESVIMKNS